MLPTSFSIWLFSVPADIADSVAEEVNNQPLIDPAVSESDVSRQNTPELDHPVRPKESSPLAVLQSSPVPTSIASARGQGTPVSPPLVPDVAVPALRIVKKTWKVHGRTDSNTSAGSSGSNCSAASSTNISGAAMDPTGPQPTISGQIRPNDGCPGSRGLRDGPSVSGQEQTVRKDTGIEIKDAAPVRASRTVIRGVQRPPAGSEMTGSAVIIPSSSVHTQSKAQTTAQAKPRASILAAEARSRFAAAGVQRPNLQQGQRAMQSRPLPAAARLQKPAVPTKSTIRVPPIVPKNGDNNSGSVAFRGPSRIAAPAAGGTATSSSALPRPASRLPAPGSISGGLRGRDTKALGTAARGTWSTTGRGL